MNNKTFYDCNTIIFRTLIYYIGIVALSFLTGCSDTITVNNGGTLLKIGLSEKGTINNICLNGKEIDGSFSAETLLEECNISLISSGKDERGRFVFVKSAVNNLTGDSCTITEYFYATQNSVRWEFEIEGKETPWTVPIVTEINYPAGETVRYWTSWGRPQIDIGKLTDDRLKKELKLMTDTSNNWLNPLVSIPLGNALYFYGAPYVTYDNPGIAFCPVDFPHMEKKYNGALISIPSISVTDRKMNTGLSIVLSPEDFTQDLTLETTEAGTVRFTRLYHRIVKTNKTGFALDIVAHKPDWRCGLDWTTGRYPEYFEPANKLAMNMMGTGAYSNHDVDFDVQKMKDMAFAINWKASFDFPYMGMFLPPVDVSYEWRSFGEKKTSIKEMQAYSKKMKESGFFVLNYFNITEFGANVIYPFPPSSSHKGEEWKNCNDYLSKYLSDAILRVPEDMNLGNIYSRTRHNGPFYTWEDGIVMDCGIKEYSDFLLEQARRHIDMVPDSYGFCIDRLDWIRMFNERTDDGRSWFAGKPVGSLVLSWQHFMEKLAPLVHENNKVIFVNNHTKRLDLLKNTDGFFDEFTYGESALNTTAFTAVKKPFSGWTGDVSQVRQDGADNFFQKYLYMGAFPMCPFPGNDHSIRPDDWVDRQYLDYGHLMNMMKGREWVLTDDPVVVVDGTAKANLFKVPDGYIVPVVFGASDTVAISVDMPSGTDYQRIMIQYPGDKISSEVRNAKVIDGKLIVTVPLKKGCAMVKITSAV